MIATALAMGLITAVSGALAELMAVNHEMVARSDLMLRARQINRFLADQSVFAQLPGTRASIGVTNLSDPAWDAPADPCISPLNWLERIRWGGVAIVDVTRLDCLRGEGVGLYIESVLPCPEFCGQGPGFVVTGPLCDSRGVEGAYRQVWRVRWQAAMELPVECQTGTVWGRLARLILTSGRSTHGGVTQSTLRLSQMSDDALYRWRSAETLVTGLLDWQVIPLRNDRLAHESGAAFLVVFALGHDERVLAVNHGTHSFSRLLVPRPPAVR
ncbi:MAG: hypothetical protein P8M73_01250 [Luminiphilus sp.]|nr:hypothetical protein [Luminiphilus sp.]